MALTARSAFGKEYPLAVHCSGQILNVQFFSSQANAGRMYTRQSRRLGQAYVARSAELHQTATAAVSSIDVVCIDSHEGCGLVRWTEQTVS